MGIKDEAEKIKEKLDNEKKEQVRVALFGRSGVGKSSIINKIIGEYVAKTGQGKDITDKRQDYEWNGLILSDLPGYGTQQFPADTYFQRLKILEDFDLFICVFTDRIYEPDIKFFENLRKNGKSCIFVRSREDEIWDDQKTSEELKQDIIDATREQLKNYHQKIVFVSSRTNKGFDTLSYHILSFLSDTKKNRWYESAKAYSQDFLDKKKEQAKETVVYYAGISAANGLNPIPGADVAVDVSVLVNLFSNIRKIYGLSDEVLKKYQNILNPSLQQTLNNVIKFVSKEGILLLLQTFAGKEVVRRFGKWIPFVGPLIAASAGFMITKSAGDAYVEDCHKVANEILEQEIKQKDN